MGKQLTEIPPKLQEFITQQKMFFVATAAQTGKINLSPKGMDSLRVLTPTKIVWLNLTGSGNETAAHIHASNRMTLMFCAFDGNPLILRLYGTAKVYHERDAAFANYASLFPNALGARQFFELDIDLVQTSCGFGVPLMSYQGERGLMEKWALQKGEEGIKNYWRDKNQLSLDGLDTQIF